MAAQSHIMLVTGGARSGKSSYAETRAAECLGVFYLATAQASDEEMIERIARHRARRPADWKTWERYRGFENLPGVFEPGVQQTLLVDCLGNLLMGILFEELAEPETCSLAEYDRVEALAMAELDYLMSFAREQGLRLIAVTNEIGLGLVPADRLSRYYRDILGRMNRRVADEADEVVFLISGIPLVIKGAPASASTPLDSATSAPASTPPSESAPESAHMSVPPEPRS